MERERETDKRKSCIFCAVNNCDLYLGTIRVQCHELTDEQATMLRQETAWGCKRYETTDHTENHR